MNTIDVIPLYKSPRPTPHNSTNDPLGPFDAVVFVVVLGCIDVHLCCCAALFCGVVYRGTRIGVFIYADTGMVDWTLITTTTSLTDRR